MSKSTKAKVSLGPSTAPQVYEATLGAGGRVVKGAAITTAQAEALRAAGQDVVVCGPDINQNRQLARTIEVNANAAAIRHPPHVGVGPGALPHYQPNPRPPAGHTFYETPNRTAV